MWCEKIYLLCLMLNIVLVARANVDPYKVIQASSFNHKQGGLAFPKSSSLSKACVGALAGGNYLLYTDVNFSTGGGAIGVVMNVASGMNDNEKARITFRLDSMTAPIIASYQIEPTGSWNRWNTTTLIFAPDSRPTGTHNLYFGFEAESPRLKGYLVNVAWFALITRDAVCAR